MAEAARTVSSMSERASQRRRPLTSTVENLARLGIVHDLPAIDSAPVARSGWARRYLAVAVGLDLVATALGFIVAYAIPFGPAPIQDPLLLVAPLTWFVCLVTSGTYHRHSLGSGTQEYRAVGRSAVLTLAALAVASFVFKVELYRGFVIPAVALWLAGSLGLHWALRLRVGRRRSREECMFDTIVVGRADTVAAMIREFSTSRSAGYRVVGACVSDVGIGWTRQTEIEGVPVIGSPDDAVEAVDRLGAEVVAVSADPDLTGQALQRLGWALAERNVDLVVAPGIFGVAGPRLSLRPAAGMSILHVERPSDGLARLTAKRVMDVLLAVPITLAALPVMVVIAVAVKATSRGPVFFLQERIGEHGRTFRMIKFRSMVVDAEARLASMDREGQVNSILFKAKDDPRITTVGRVIRKYSLDELPQLFNVLRGQMSLVGPRPSLEREVAKYEFDAIHRLRAMPGLTGLWQTSGRSNLDWEQSLRLDLWYVDNWSPVLDLQILFRTFRTVFGGHGAY